MIQIYTDGATEGYNGRLGTVTHCGIGVVCPEKRFELSRRIEAISNNEAEFWALIVGMKWASLEGLEEVEFCSDSMIVVNRANRWCKPDRDPGNAMTPENQHQRERYNAMNKLHRIVDSLKKEFKEVKFTWISRERNWLADVASKQALLY